MQELFVGSSSYVAAALSTEYAVIKFSASSRAKVFKIGSFPAGAVQILQFRIESVV